jgi:septum formation protein
MRLFLASKSASRRALLEDVKIPFTVVHQDADEHFCDWDMPIEQLVLSIARHKLDHAELPLGTEGEHAIVVTADTLVQDRAGGVYGKPDNRADAVRQLRALRDGLRVVTGMWVDRRCFSLGRWVSERLESNLSQGTALLALSNADIEEYLDAAPFALSVAGSLLVDGYGAQFVTEVHGSWTGMLGLPIPELKTIIRQLEDL